jgi:NitT/TauT family transport system substrate-binding protein
MLRNTLKFVASIALCASLFQIPGSASAEELTKIVVHGYPGSLISLYPKIGIEYGFYKAEGLDASMLDIISGPEANAALAGGSVNFVLNTNDNLILAQARGLDVVAVVGNQTRNFYSLVAAKSLGIKPGTPYKEVMKALVGKRIGINASGTNNNRFARELFSSAGIDPSQASFVVVGGPPGAIAALASGQADAILNWEPFQTVATLTGKGTVVVDCRVPGQCPEALEKPGRAFQSYYTSKKFLAANPKAVEGFVRAHIKIDAWVQDPANRAKVLEAVKKVVPPPAGLNISGDEYAKSVLDGSLPAFGVTTDPAGLEAWNQQLLDYKLISAPVPVKDILWDKAPRPK